MKVIRQSVENLSCTSNAMKLIELAGRTCYKSEGKITDDSAEAFVRMLLKRGHESVLEHASATFKIICDRGVSHEIVRHRIASYSQESTRYVKYGELEVVIPDELIDELWTEVFGQGFPVHVTEDNLAIRLSPSQKAWSMACLDAESGYTGMLNAGEKPQTARSVLPTCLKTELVMTANFREWRHFIRLRTAKGAHPQIQEIAGLIKDWFDEKYPVIMEFNESGRRI